MFYQMKVPGSVFVFGRIAASHVPASQTQAEMNPRIAHLHAFFADVGGGVPDFDLVEMSALLSHASLS